MHANHISNFYKSKTLLGTAQVLITSSVGQQIKFRALIDSGSDSCLITRAAAALLRLPRKQYNTHTTALGGTSVAKSNKIISCIVSSIHDSESIIVDAIVMPNLTFTRPPSILQTTNWAHLQHIPLADPSYFQANKLI